MEQEALRYAIQKETTSCAQPDADSLSALPNLIVVDQAASTPRLGEAFGLAARGLAPSLPGRQSRLVGDVQEVVFAPRLAAAARPEGDAHRMRVLRPRQSKLGSIRNYEALQDTTRLLRKLLEARLSRLRTQPFRTMSPVTSTSSLDWRNCCIADSSAPADAPGVWHSHNVSYCYRKHKGYICANMGVP